MLNRKRLLLHAIAVASISTLLALGGSSATAAESPSSTGGATTADTATPTMISNWTFRSTVVNKVKYINRAGKQILGRCLIGTRGGTCTISKGKTATRTIEIGGGVTRGMVAGSLGISTATSTTVEVGCTSPALDPGDYWTARPFGTKYVYDVRKSKYFLGVKVDSAIVEENLRAFSPYRSQIYCY